MIYFSLETEWRDADAVWLVFLAEAEMVISVEMLDWGLLLFVKGHVWGQLSVTLPAPVRVCGDRGAMVVPSLPKPSSG